MTTSTGVIVPRLNIHAIKAYPIAQQYTQAQLFKEILAIALEFNAHFDVPMFENEVRHIAWSIARYCKSGRFGCLAKNQKRVLAKDSL